jgi:hypothetical protein
MRRAVPAWVRFGDMGGKLRCEVLFVVARELDSAPVAAGAHCHERVLIKLALDRVEGNRDAAIGVGIDRWADSFRSGSPPR